LGNEKEGKRFGNGILTHQLNHNKQINFFPTSIAKKDTFSCLGR